MAQHHLIEELEFALSTEAQSVYLMIEAHYETSIGVVWIHNGVHVLREQDDKKPVGLVPDLCNQILDFSLSASNPTSAVGFTFRLTDNLQNKLEFNFYDDCESYQNSDEVQLTIPVRFVA